MSASLLRNREEDLTETGQVHLVELPLEVLLSGVIYLSGGRAKDGTPVITCSSHLEPSSITELKEKEALDLLLHFSTLSGNSDKNKGVTVIINSTTLPPIAVTTLLQAVGKFQATLPGLLRWLLVIKPVAGKQDTQLTCVESSATCKVVHLDDYHGLLQYIDESSLTSDLGGSLVYDHQEWVKYRLKVEPFMSDCKSLSCHLFTVIDELNSELPSTTAKAESALKNHQEQWSARMRSLHVTQLMDEGKRLITAMESPHPSLKENPEFQSSLRYVRHLLKNVTEVKVKLDLLCSRLTDNFRVRKFEKEARMMISWFVTFGEEYLAINSDAGETLEEIAGMLTDMETIEKSSQVHCQSLISSAAEFLRNPNFTSHRGWLAELKEQLANNLSTFHSSVAEWKDKMREAMEVHNLTQKVLSWCIETAEMLEAHDTRNTAVTSEEVDGYIQEVDSWSTASAVTDEELAKLEQSAEVCILPYVQEIAFFAINHMKELQRRVPVNKVSLEEMLRCMSPHEKASDSDSEELIEGTQGVASAAQQDEGARSPPATLSSQLTSQGMEMVVLTSSNEVDKALEDLEIAVMRLQEDRGDWVMKNEGATDIPTGPGSQKDDFTDSGRFDSPAIPMIQLLRPERVSESAEKTKAAKMVKKRKNIVQELIETEEKYVKDLEHVVNNYIAEWEECMKAVAVGGMVRTLPAALIGNRNTLFCNIEQLLQFAQDVFLPELRKLEKSPMRLGTVFCQSEVDLMQYALYFKNLLAQEAIMKDAGAKFFAETQLRLGDPFTLSSYLNKPFERMARYKLFIVEMIKNTIKGAVLDNLRRAERMVVFILRHGNDLLAVDNLSGVEGGTTQFGKIRHQGDLLSIEGKLKKPERRVFLFEQGIVIAKKQAAPKGSLMNEVFHTKIQLRLNELSMREEIIEQPTQFELTDRKKMKYLFQASSREEKEEWLSDLRDLFLEQMLALKEQAEQNMALSVRTPGRLRAATHCSPQCSRVYFPQRRLSSDNTSLLHPASTTSGYSESSEASMAMSSTSKLILQVDNLSGVEGGITQLGKIRRQGDLLSIEGKLKKPERRVFLFEQGIVIAKKQAAPKGSLMNEVFHTKIQLRLNELSMREDISEQPTQFELTDRKKMKYLFQASSREEKEEWVSDLRDLFLEQMLALKEQAEQNMALRVRTPRRLRATTQHSPQCSRVYFPQRRLSSDNTSLLHPAPTTSGYSESSEASIAMSSTSKLILQVDNLSGVEGGITQLGKIRRQGDLLSIEGKLKKPERRVFLFEQGIVIAKKQAAPKGSLMNEVFHTKIQLRLNELSIREEIGEQPTQFELTDQKKMKYLFQASSREEKEEWVSDLRDLFLEQMLALKDMKSLWNT